MSLNSEENTFYPHIHEAYMFWGNVKMLPKDKSKLTIFFI